MKKLKTLNDYFGMMIDRRFEIGINIFFWLTTGWLIINALIHALVIDEGIRLTEVKEHSEILLLLMICLMISGALFYGNLFNILQLANQKSSARVILFSLMYLILATFIYYFIEYHYFPHMHLKLSPRVIIGIFMFYFTASIAYGIVKVWQRSEFQKQQFAIDKKQAELTLLRSKLHPHFLFNVLNNLLSMVDQKNNPALADSLERLSGLLRYVVMETPDSKVSVQKEIEFINNFADLQALRFKKEEIDFKLEIAGDNDNQKIEPGIFIPFIENAFKYGAEPEKKSKVEVSFDLSLQTKIVFSVKNTIHPTMQKLKGNGTGIPSSRARLELVYPNKHKLDISENDYFHVRLELETDESNYS